MNFHEDYSCKSAVVISVSKDLLLVDLFVEIITEDFKRMADVRREVSIEC
jgi:hypothetical protein